MTDPNSGPDRPDKPEFSAGDARDRTGPEPSTIER